jgi:hypothetical protein
MFNIIDSGPRPQQDIVTDCCVEIISRLSKVVSVLVATLARCIFSCEDPVPVALQGCRLGVLVAVLFGWWQRQALCANLQYAKSSSTKISP